MAPIGGRRGPRVGVELDGARDLTILKAYLKHMAATSLLPENIHPLTDFLRHHKRHLQRLKRSQRPAVLTLNGKAEVVVQDAKAYQAMMEDVEAMQAHAGIAEGLASMVRGQGDPAETVFARLRRKHGFKPAR